MTVDLIRLVVAVGLTALLAWASYCDVMHRRLPNLASLLAIALFIPWGLTGTPAELGGAVAAFLAAGVLTFGLYAFGIIGAGDCKLFTALALFSGISLLPHYTVATALSGGVVAVGCIAANPAGAFAAWQARSGAAVGRGVPYGVAIAAGALAVIWLQALGWSHLLVGLFILG